MGKSIRFAPVPKASKSQIDRAGEILIGLHNIPIDELERAVDLAQQWRACHAYPINTFQATLRRKLAVHKGEYLVAQRLKRMPTIFDKLQRFPAMNLTTMQDIGGVRAVLSSIAKVYKLAKEYKNKTRFEHELIREMDYIQNPNDETGYRSLHLIYKYKNKQNPHYDGLRLELQLRTKLQHIWATAVETMGTFLGQSLKSRRGDQEWLDFFAITSSSFAYWEKTPRVPRFAHLNEKETAQEVVKAEAKLGAINMMTGFSVAVNQIAKTKWAYHLIILNSLERKVELIPYDRYSLEQATRDYSRFEKEAASGRKIEPVLVSAGPIDKLRKAYPNFFLDIGDFVSRVTKVISGKNR